ncbi:MAG: hypothetical protein ACT4O9_01320 [Blastocatellia bacterium]
MSENEQYLRKMTPARVIEGTDDVEVIFLESAQFYSLPKKTAAFDQLIAILNEAVEKCSAVEIGTASITSSVIENIRPAR